MLNLKECLPYVSRGLLAVITINAMRDGNTDTVGMVQRAMKAKHLKLFTHYR